MDKTSNGNQINIGEQVVMKAWIRMEYVALVILVLALWGLLSYLGILNPLLLPSPVKIFEAAAKTVQNGTLFENIWVSVVRVFRGFALAAVSGLILGILMGLSKHMYNFFDLLVQLIRPIPPIAWIPLAILWFGTGESSKTFLIFLGGFFTILINVIDGIHQVDVRLLELARTLETPKRKFITQLILPSALPNIFTGIRTGIGACWMCVVAAELVAASSGMGYMINHARQFSNTSLVILGMIGIGITGKVMDWFIKLIEKRTMKWL